MAEFDGLITGLRSTVSRVVSSDMLATAAGSGTAPVLSTPHLVALMEAAACRCVDHLLPPGFETLGVALAIQHVAATPPGLTVEAKARLEARDGRTLTFTVEAHDGVERIGGGTHTRAIARSDGFRARAAAKSPPEA